MKEEFYNPYAFVPPAPHARSHHAAPRPQGTLGQQRWSGHLEVCLIAVTPLLITEQGRVDGRAARRVRRVDGAVAVPSTAVKGMLRSEVEMATGSRYGVFGEHRGRLGFRTTTRESDTVPARIVRRDDGRLQAHVLRGMPHPAGRPLPAAWVPRYGRTRPDLPAAEHGTPVHAWVVLMRRTTKNRNDREQTLDYWKVVAMGHDLVPQPTALPLGGGGRHAVLDGTPRPVTGWYAATGHNAPNKKAERLFFDVRETPELHDLGDGHVQAWVDLLRSYRDAHDTADLVGRPGHGALEWSRHLLLPEGHPEATGLPEGTLCYVRLRGRTVRGLFPVGLSRELYDTSPATLAAAAGLSPAESHDQLSPADRLFGWVHPARDRERAGTAAVRGRVRVGPVRPVGPVEPERVDRGLAVLGAPRPTQDLFYAAKDAAGTPLDGAPRSDRTTRDGEPADRRGYRATHGLRGRKVYPHQPGTRWDLAGPHAWLRGGTGLDGAGQPLVDSQNALLEDRVPAGARFRVRIDLDDVDDAELGALLLVLRGRPGDTSVRHHRLGGAAPLGFGSVTLSVDLARSDVRRGSSWSEYFALEARGGTGLDDDVAAGLVRDVLVAAGEPAPHLDAYEHYLRGFPARGGGRRPVHYPADPNRDEWSHEERFAWFVANRAGRAAAPGALQDGYAGLQLPLDPAAAADGAARPTRGGHR